MFTYIASNPEILNGKPYIVDTRLSVEFVLELFAKGATKEEIIQAYPQLTVQAVEEVLKYKDHFQKTVDFALNKNVELYRRLS